MKYACFSVNDTVDFALFRVNDKDNLYELIGDSSEDSKKMVSDIIGGYLPPSICNNYVSMHIFKSLNEYMLLVCLKNINIELVDIAIKISKNFPDDKWQEIDLNEPFEKEDAEDSENEIIYGNIERFFKLPSFTSVLDIPIQNGTIYQTENDEFYLETDNITACEFFELKYPKSRFSPCCSVEELRTKMGV